MRDSDSECNEFLEKERGRERERKFKRIYYLTGLLLQNIIQHIVHLAESFFLFVFPSSRYYNWSLSINLDDFIWLCVR